MRKFLTAILFLMLVTVGYAQCINVEITPIKGNCYTDNQIKVTAKDMSPFPSICLPSSGKFTVQIKGDGVNQMVRMTPNPVPTPGAPAEYTFYNIKMGKYTIIVRDEVTGAFEENEVEVESNYKLMNVTNIEALAPSCDQPNTGGIKFRIPNGGIGPFEVTVLDMSRNVIIPMQVLPRPTGSNYIEIRGDNSHPLPKGKVFILEIKDQTNIGPQCGHTLRYPSLEIPSQSKYVVACLNIKTYSRHYNKSSENCGKFNFDIRLVRPEDNQWIYYNIEDMQAFREFFKRPGTAVVRFLNSSKPAIDMSSTFYDYGYRVDSFIFEKGDEIEMTIKGPKNTIVERYKFNTELDFPTGRICNSIFTTARDNSYNRSDWRELTCGSYTLTTNKYLSAYYNIPSTQSRYAKDLNNAQNLLLYVGGWTNGYSNLKLQRKVGSTWVDETGYPTSSNTPTVPGATYRFVYKTVPPGCPSGASCEFVIDYPPFTIPPQPSHNFSLENIWKYTQIGYGVYEGTGAFRIYHHSANVYYPIKYTVMPADGTKTITYQAKIAFMDTFTRTITFPIEYSSDRTNCSYQGSAYFNLTNLPAGNYIVVASTCGQTSTRTITLPGMPPYKPQFTYVKDCDVMKITYNIGNQIHQDPGISVYLDKYQEDQWGNASWQSVKSTSGHSGTFPNLSAGKYRVRTSGYYYNAYLPSGYVPLGTNNTHSISRYDVCDPGLPTESYSSPLKSKEIDITALRKLTPIINPVVCAEGSSTGKIAVDITGEEVFFPVTYYLNRLNSATDTGTGVTIASKTYQLTDNKYYHLFENVPNGYYKVIVSHRCEDVPQNFDLNLSAAFDPFLTIDRPVPFCKGNQARVGISVSENIFDIKWYKADKDGNKLSSAPYKVGQTFWDPIYDTTYYVAEYSLRPGLGCTNNTIYTKTATVVMPPIDEPPLPRKPCPNDIVQTADPGQCSKIVRWREPEYFPTCHGAITTTRTHAPGDLFPIGLTTVTYTFTDPKGNTSSCTFFITIKSNAIKIKKSHRYVDTSGNPITQVQVNQPFYYELRYENAGAETISKAVINVKLPNNATLISNGAPDLSGAGDGSWSSPRPTSAYSSSNKTWHFEIGSNGTTSSLKAGDPERLIRIPLKVEGDCNTLFAPCESYLQTDLSLNYEGGPQGCPSAAVIEESTLSTTIDTSGCDRQEVHCGTGAITFNAIGGFTTYQWYDSTGAILGAIRASYSPINPGVYKVVKTVSCHGVNLTVTETIDYKSMSEIALADPIKAQAQNIGVTCPQTGGWTSQFYLCTGGSKVISVDYNNTPYEWQIWNGSCNTQASTQPTCRIETDDCWSTLSSGNRLTLTTAGLYRLKFLNSGCDKSFYFQVITGGLSGSLSNKKDETPFEQGSVDYQLSASGVQYKVEIYRNGTLFRTDIKTDNTGIIENLTEGSYRFKFTSPQIPGCEYTANETIGKQTDMKMTATFKGFKEGSCNTAKLHLKAEAGQPTYRFYIWKIDGQKQYTDEATALASAPIALQLGSQGSGVDVEIPNITRVGEYEFIVGDQRNGAKAYSNKVLISPPAPHSFTVSATQEIQCESNPNSGHINLIFAPGSQNINRTINLYKLDNMGARVLPVFKTSGGGLFTGLPAGTYEVEMISNVASATCRFVKKPIEIKPTQAPLRAYAGVVADRSCDTANNQYKVAVNNVSGGTPPYRYSFDGEASYVPTNIGYISGSSTIYVKDSKDCRVSIPVRVEATSMPTISLSPIAYRCDNGYGSVTITLTSSASQTYQYILDGSATQTLVGNTIHRTLAPGMHSLTVYYTPANSSTTPNVLFTEDFGTGDVNTCVESVNTDLVCGTSSTTLQDGQQLITKQAPAKAGWTIPSDPTGGRYLAIAGNGNGEVAYKRTLSGVALNVPLTVSIDAVSLLTTTGVPAQFRVALCKADGTALITKPLGAVTNGAGWKNLSVTFTAAEVTGFTNNNIQIKILSSALHSYSALGSDFALDNLKVSQATTYCQLKVTEFINVEANKQMRVEKYGSEKNVSCIGAADGQVSIRVVNAPSANVKYAVIDISTSTLTWTPTTLDAQGVFTITGLEATQIGSVQVQDATQANCIGTVEYKIGSPTPIVPSVVLMERVTCLNNGRAKIKVSATGGNAAGYQYQLVSVTTGFVPATPTPNPQEIVNIPAGTYTLVVKDKNGCTTETTVIIDGMQTLTVSAEPTSMCYGIGEEKKIVLTVISANGTSYKVTRAGGNTYTFNSNIYTYPDALEVGTHTFTITDGYGCKTTVSAEIYAPLSLQVSPTTQLYASCNGSTQSFDLSVTGGVPTLPKEFSYSIDGGITFTHIASSTTSASVSIAVPTATSTIVQFAVSYKPDGSECRRVRFVNISYDPPRFLTSTFTTTKAICGEDNGSVIITPADYYVGTTSHTLVIRNAANVVQTSTTAMAAGNYVAYLTDARGCVATQAFTIDKVDPLVSTATITKQMGCTAADLAEITVTLGTGGTAPYVVKVLNTGTNAESTRTATSNNISIAFGSLDYGNYQVTITDANACNKEHNLVINPNSSVMSITFPTVLGCVSQTHAIISATSSGTFTATTKAYFAVYRTGIQNPPNSSGASVINTTNTVSGTDTWYAATASGTGVTVSIPNLTPGVRYTFVAYNITTGCRFTQQAASPAPGGSTLTATLDIQNVKCAAGNDGTFTYTLANVQGSTVGISWNIYKADTHQSVAAGSVLAPPPFNTPANVNTNLPAGKYYITFREMPSGCVNSFDFEIKRSAIEMQITTAETKKATCITKGQIWLGISGGTATYTYNYVMAGGAAPTVYTETAMASKYVEMPAGVWDVYVRDAFGCLKMSTVTVTAYDVPNVVTATTLACQAYTNNNGKIPVRIDLNKIGQGAHFYSLDGAATQTIQWTESNKSFEVEVTPLVAHTVTVTDVNGCASGITFSTTSLITATATLTKLKSCATPTAQVTVSVSGGTGTYSYTLERLDNGTVAGETIATDAAFPTPTGGVITLGTATFTQEATYRMYIYDAQTADCRPIVKEFVIQDPEPIDLTGIVVQPYHEKCNLGLTATPVGSIEVVMPKRSTTEAYTFAIISAIDLTTGNTLTVTATPTTSGTHTATFTGLRGTSQGVKYDILITNQEGCTAGVYTVLNSPEPISFEDGVLTATQYKCENGAGFSTPKVVLDVTKIKGGVPPYTTEFYSTASSTLLGNGTEYRLPDLSGGSYYVLVKDNAGCSSATISVTVAPAFELTTLSVTTIVTATCAVDEQIRIDVGTTGYIAGTMLRYTIQGTDNSIATVTTVASPSLTISLLGSKNLKGSGYTIEVINEQTGCSITGVHKVKDPNTFAIVSSNPVRAVCHTDYGAITLLVVDTDLSDGDQSAGFTYTITSVGSTSPTNISGSEAGNTMTITGQLKGGTYDIEATSNATGCAIAKHRFIVPSNPDEIRVTDVIQKVSVDCDNKNAIVALTVSGGQQTYTVVLTPILGTPGGAVTQTDVPSGAPGVEFAGLNAGLLPGTVGTYQITITDALGCTSFTGSSTITIDPYDSIQVASVTAQVSSITCVGAKDGKLKVSNVKGGTRPYYYVLVSTVTNAVVQSINKNASEYTFEGIESGTYKVVLYDAKNCDAELPTTFVFTDPQPISADIDENNSSFFTCSGQNNGSLTIDNLVGGTGTYTIDIVRADNNQKIAGHIDVTGTTDTFSNLPPSPKDTYYQLVIKDSNGCVMTKTLTFEVVEFPDINVNYVEKEGTCEANTNDYKDYLVVKFRSPEVDFSKITYSLNGTATRTSFVRTLGNVGYIEEFDRTVVSQTIEVHYDTAVPVSGHCTANKSFTIDLYVPLTLTDTTSSATAINTVQVEANGGTVTNLKGYTYYYNGVDRGDSTTYKINHNDPERIAPDGTRIKIVSVMVKDANGCTATLTLEVPYHDIEVPNFFTPDGDGENDVWKPRYLDNNVNARIYIFDRYGRRLANLAPGEGWDGQYDGRLMPSGDYWYIIEINDQLYDKRQFYGNFTLYR